MPIRSASRSFHATIDGLLFDYSKQSVTSETMRLLFDLAEAAGLEARRAALFAGEVVNPTEHRAALHMALRNVSGRPMQAQGKDVMPEVIDVRDRMGAFAEGIRSGRDRRRRAAPNSPTSSTSASAGPTSARRWPRGRCRPSSRRACRCTSSPTSTGPISATF